MTNSILSSLLAKSVTTFTNESTGFAVWTDAKVVEVEIQSSSDNSDNPLSTEQVNDTTVSNQLLAADIQTGKILQPTHLKVTVLTDNLSLVENIVSLWADTTVTLSVTSKSIISDFMAISSIEIEHSPEMLSAAKVVMMLEQTRISKIVPFDPDQPSDQNDFGLSLLTPPSVGANLSSIQNRVGTIVDSTSSAVSSLYNRVVNSIGL